MTTTDTALPNPIRPEFWVRPAPEIESDLSMLRAAPLSFHTEPPIPLGIDFPEGAGCWAVTKHQQILEVSKNPDIYSSAAGITIIDAPPEFNEFFGSMIAMDDPRHARLRKLVSAGFTPRMLEKLEGGVARQAARIVDRICERGSCDFVVDVAARLPLQIVCDLMGIPESLIEFVFEQTNIVLGAGDPEYVPDVHDILTSLLLAGQGLSDLMHDVARSKKGGTGDDLTTILVNATVDGEQLTGAEIASFFILLVVAGNETTRNAIAWGLKYLSDNPDQKQLWLADPDAVEHTAVEEIVRLASPVTYMRRTALTDTELAGQKICKGDKLAMFYLAANRDEDVFDDPFTFDVRRDPNPHVGFGGPGPHFCLGAHLARREIRLMWRELLTRLPDIEASGPPDLLLSSFIHGVKHLPAEFTPIPG